MIATTKRTRIRTPKGFTLLELMVVLLIILILLGVGVGASRGLRPNQVGTVETEAMRMFSGARSLALNKESTVRVLVHLDESQPRDYARVMALAWWNQEVGLWQVDGSIVRFPEAVFFDADSCPAGEGEGTGRIDLATGEGGQGSLWRYYEFHSNGSCPAAGERFLIGKGVLAVNGGVSFTEPRLKRGFVLRSSGAPLTYQGPDQI